MGITFNPRRREIVVTGVNETEMQGFPKIASMPWSWDAKRGFVISLQGANQVTQFQDIVMVKPMRWNPGKEMTTRYIFKAPGFVLFQVKQGPYIGYTMSGNVIDEELE